MLTSTSPPWQNTTRGQSLVELSLTLTVLLILLSGAVSFGMAYFSYVAIRDAAQEGALYGSLSPCIDNNPANGLCEANEGINVPGICDRVKAAATRPDGTQAGPVNLSGFACINGFPSAVNENAIYISAVGIACEGNTAGVPNGVTVAVKYGYPVFMPFLGAITGDHIYLTASVTDTILEPRCPAP